MITWTLKSLLGYMCLCWLLMQLLCYSRKTVIAAAWICSTIHDSLAGSWSGFYKTSRCWSASWYQRVCVILYQTWKFFGHKLLPLKWGIYLCILNTHLIISVMKSVVPVLYCISTIREILQKFGNIPFGDCSWYSLLSFHPTFPRHTECYLGMNHNLSSIPATLWSRLF